MRGQQDHLRARIDRAHLREEFVARHPRHHEVSEHHVELAQPEAFERALAGRGFLDVEAFFAERVGGYLTFEIVVFYDEYG